MVVVVVVVVVVIVVVVVVPNGPVGSLRPFRVVQPTRKHDYVQTILRILYHVLFGIAGALLPSFVWHMAYSICAVGVGLR